MVLKKKGQDISRVQNVAKLCGAAWNAMSTEEKEPYTKKYNDDKARYLKEVRKVKIVMIKKCIYIS